MLHFPLVYFEFDVLDAVLFEEVGKFRCAVHDVGEFVDQQKLEILL
jgi:hypothetical protein